MIPPIKGFLGECESDDVMLRFCEVNLLYQIPTGQVISRFAVAPDAKPKDLSQATAPELHMP
jgi:hypothetical protein